MILYLQQKKLSVTLHTSICLHTHIRFHVLILLFIIAHVHIVVRSPCTNTSQMYTLRYGWDNSLRLVLANDVCFVLL